MSQNQTIMKSSIQSSSSNNRHRPCVSFHFIHNETFFIMNIDDFTDQEIVNCWWKSNDLQCFQQDCKDYVTKHYHNHKNKETHDPQFRGLELFSHAQRKAMVLELSREAVLYDHCLKTYSINSRMALREAQERAQRDALAVVDEYKSASWPMNLLLRSKGHDETSTAADQQTCTTAKMVKSKMKTQQASSQQQGPSVRSTRFLLLQ
jgi:hypothetical protein